MANSGTPYAGKSGYVKVDGTRYSFNKWTIRMETDPVIVATYDDDGYDDNIEGRSRATLDISGPYMVGGMPLVSGTSYDFILGVGSDPSTVEIPVTARVTAIDVRSDAQSKEPTGVDIKAMIRGTFDKEIT